MFKTGLRLCIGLVFFLSTMTFAVAMNDSTRSMSKQAEQFYKLVKDEKLVESREALWQLTTTFSAFNWEDTNVSVEGIHALSETLIQAKQALTRAELNVHEVHMHAIRVRLAIDALQNREQPLWHQYYKVLKHDLTDLKTVIPKGDKHQIKQAVDRLNAHYNLIKPSLYVARTPEVLEQVSALFAFMDDQTKGVSVNREQLQTAAERWENLLDPLFYGSDQEALAAAAVPDYPIIYTTWFLAILIGSVLTYVIWKKARAEQTKRVIRRF